MAAACRCCDRAKFATQSEEVAPRTLILPAPAAASTLTLGTTPPQGTVALQNILGAWATDREYTLVPAPLSHLNSSLWGVRSQIRAAPEVSRRTSSEASRRTSQANRAVGRKATLGVTPKAARGTSQRPYDAKSESSSCAHRLGSHPKVRHVIRERTPPLGKPIPPHAREHRDRREVLHASLPVPPMVLGRRSHILDVERGQLWQPLRNR